MSSQFGACLACALTIMAGLAQANPAQICDTVAARAAKENHIPETVMRAITRVETGRRRNGVLQPWPWTVNMEGKGHWFDTEDAARTYVFRQFKQGKRSFDVGCFQINYRWHGAAFRSIDDMFDPDQNARYAAAFLMDLHREMGSWDKAVGAYHSRTKTHADRYLKAYRAIANRLPAPSAQPLPTRVNGYQLLQGAGTGQRGSLMPRTLSPRGALIARGE